MTSQLVLGYTDKENIKRYEKGAITHMPVWKHKRDSSFFNDVKVQFEHSHIIGDTVNKMQTFNSGGMISVRGFNTAFSL